ncbi:hypothetical protein [Planococcus sp. S3-L1]|uniref:hypothetical protein n=1 Tax=Planococcus sp. S3-L1 TaxID=3046200 RepID=UPI0024B92D6C|nr:hypothetical protein [Planococcus sp. S3-L1]MDJ0331732.1 hypothetical protein [Planococcus sp. S3-L1]
MRFVEKIKAHQEGRYDLATELVKLALSNMVKTEMVCTEVVQAFYNEERGHYTEIFNRWRPKYPVKKDVAEYHMARNIKIWISRFTKKANGMRKKEKFEGTQLEIQDFDALEFIYKILADVGHEFYKDDFDKIPQSVYRAIESKFGWDIYDDFRSELREFQNILPAINRVKKKLEDQYTPLIIESLNEVLPKVDLTRTEEEIIGFIAISTKRKVDRKLTKLLGTKVHNIKGEKYYLTKDEIRKSKFIKTAAESILKIDENKLTTNQYSFYHSLKSKIQKEINEFNIEPFTFNENGYVIGFNKRYFAKQMDIKESAFKNKLARMKKKSALNDENKAIIKQQ